VTPAKVMEALKLNPEIDAAISASIARTLYPPPALRFRIR
jgi:hypothetical protein